jgi:hypothetical protein
VRLSEIAAPVSATNGNDAQLGDDDSGADCSGDFLGRLDAEADVALRVSDDDDGLESSTLTGARLLLDGLDLKMVRSRLKRSESHTFMTSSLSFGRKKSTIWYSLMGREWR